jgi:acyl-CoA thioester hydrolase
MESRISIRPRFSETDALGHINNTTIPVWFEEGRLHLVYEEAKIDQKTVLARFEVDYLHEVLFGQDIEVRTFINRLGNSSISYQQTIYQADKLCLKASAVSVTYDTKLRSSVPISQDTRVKLQTFVQNDSPE